MALFDELARCRGWIEAALRRSGGTHNFDDVARLVLTGQLQFWPLPNSVVLTEIQQFPRLRKLHTFAAGGNMDEILAHESVLEEFARANGCASMTCSGRRGWLRKVQKQGLQPASYTTERIL